MANNGKPEPAPMEDEKTPPNVEGMVHIRGDEIYAVCKGIRRLTKEIGVDRALQDPRILRLIDQISKPDAYEDIFALLESEDPERRALIPGYLKEGFPPSQLAQCVIDHVAPGMLGQQPGELNIVEFGPGTGAEAIHIIRSIRAQLNRRINYRGIEGSERGVTLLWKNLREGLGNDPGVRFEVSHDDMHQWAEQNAIKVQAKQSRYEKHDQLLLYMHSMGHVGTPERFEKLMSHLARIAASVRGKAMIAVGIKDILSGDLTRHKIIGVRKGFGDDDLLKVGIHAEQGLVRFFATRKALRRIFRRAGLEQETTLPPETIEGYDETGVSSRFLNTILEPTDDLKRTKGIIVNYSMEK
ncbi:MAG: hypothetical protein V1760_03390 [Candidatus Peregrinibacteria bacterium]